MLRRHDASIRPRPAAWLCVIALAATAGAARADMVVANNFENGYQSSGFFSGIGFTGPGFPNEASGQRFVAQASGTLTTITASVDRFAADNVPLNVLFYEANGPVPGTLLGSLTVPPEAVAFNLLPGQFGPTFDFSAQGIVLEAGQSYVVAFTADDPLAGSVRYRALRLADNPNFFGIQPLLSRDGGATWENSSGTHEIGLIVRASAVPEPSSLLLVGGGLVILGSLSRRRWRGGRPGRHRGFPSRPGVVGYLALGALGAALFSPAPASADEKRQPPPSDQEITNLIRQLGDDEFAAREKAHQALLQIGKPAVAALCKAVRDAADVEVRRRAKEIVEQIDPGAARRAELEGTRAALLKAVAAVQGVDVKNWAESVANPFTELTDEGKKRLTAEGIDVARLQKMRARYLKGSYGGALAKEFVNTDPDTILVVGKGFCTHGGVYSAGPVLAAEDAYFMSRVNVANLLWFVDRAGTSDGVKGAPVLAAAGAGAHALRATPGILVGDYGWRPPKSFLQPLTAADAKNDPPATDELAKAKKELAEQVKKARAVDVTQVAKEVANPFTALTEEGKAKLKLRGVDPGRLPKLKAVYLTGSFCGADSKDFVNNDPDTVLVIGKGFVTHGRVCSLGPVLAVEDAHFMGDVTGADVVWFADQSFPRGQTKGAPVILAPTARHSQMRVGTKHVWQGDYGWRAPKDFPGQGKAGADKKD